MARLPVPGGDDGTWGAVLNAFLLQAHKSDGTLQDGSVTGSSLADGAVTESKLSPDVQSKLGAAPVQSVNGKTGVVVLAKADVGLASVDNTADVDKPISVATQAALDAKYVKPVSGIPESDLDSSVQAKLDAPASAGYVVGSGIAKITVGSTAPTNPQVGDIWVATP